MQIKFYCPRWGLEYLSFEEACRKIKEAGYDGLESSVPFDASEREQLKNAAEKYELDLAGVQHAASGRNGYQYLESFRHHIENILPLQPYFINSQTGCDYFDFEENKLVFEYCRHITEQTGIPIYHELHRGKALFCAKVGAQYIDRLPYLHLTADFSHWCNVSESYLQDQQESVRKAISRTRYIHARVGHPEGPQITDPREPECREALQHHLAWWDAIVAARRADGTAVLVIQPEFGPAPYMTINPKTKQPLVDQWEVNLYMRDLLKERYKEYVRTNISTPAATKV